VGIGWHWLRHANATLLDAVGTPLGTVQALLGHSSSEITREVYLHSIPADARAAVGKVEELLKRPKLSQVAENSGRGTPPNGKLAAGTETCCGVVARQPRGLRRASPALKSVAC
jgi:hypothetical protein